MAQEWNISSRGHSCRICTEQFNDKQPCVSALRATSDTFERWDFCRDCWKNNPPGDWQPFSLWENVYEAPAREVKEEHVKKDTAESLLRRLVLLEDPAMQNVVYVLAVMLERAKQLVERDTKLHESGGILRIYEHRKSGDSFVILDPRLRLDQLAPVQEQVIAILSGAVQFNESNEPQQEPSCQTTST